MILEKINNFVWGNGLIFLLLFTGAMITYKLKFIQFRMPYLIFRSRNSENSGLSQFKTVCMSLGTAMGTGNIVGTASALALGGAGAVFWMWISAFFGMALVYAENVLSAKYSDETLKGPMAYLTKGLGCPVLAWIFALFCVMASLGMGSMVQISTFADSLQDCTDFSRPLAAVIIFAVVFLTVRGGSQRIGTAAQFLLPAASAAYTLVCIAVIAIHGEKLPDIFSNIFAEAFGLREAAGGISGYALSVGIRRGIFSNEAGLGSSPILHSAAENTSPETQGAWSMFEVFFDTIFCCTLTAMAILCGSDCFSVSEAVSSVLGGFSVPFITAELGIFSFCTVIGWFYCGIKSFSHISKGKYIGIFTAVYALSAACGAVFSPEAVWLLSDIFNGLMAFPNLLGLFLLMNRIKDR